ncbi:MBL fold metallo-hydrolase [Planctomycetota bacterium]
MRVETVSIGMFQAQAHIAIDEATSECAIIDTGENGVGIKEAVDRIGAKPVFVLLTHGHIDHAGGLAEMRRCYPEVPIRMHKGDLPYVENMVTQGRMFGVEVEPAPPLDTFLHGGEQIDIGSGVCLKVIATPGHSPGGVVFYEPHAHVAFVGDTLFQGSIGRTDLPGGSAKTLLSSLRERVLTFPEETRCYTGHGPSTTVGEEKAHNPFLRPGAEAFLGLG